MILTFSIYFEKNRYRVPTLIVSTLIIVCIYLSIRGWTKYVLLFISQWTQKDRTILFMGDSPYVHFVGVVLSGVLLVLTWLLSTRVKFYKRKILRVATFYLTCFGIVGSILAYGTGKMTLFVLPYFTNMSMGLTERNVITDGTYAEGIMENAWGSVLPEDIRQFLILLMIIPSIVVFLVGVFLRGRYIQFDERLKQNFFEFEWKGRWLQKFESMEVVEKWPDIILGENSKTHELVILPGRDRTLNTSIIGSIGTGKTAALGLPTINQDLHHMAEYINDYPTIYLRDDFETEEVRGRYLNGLSIIEPSNDLCQKALKLVKAHNIPDDAITYINPLDPDTPNINPMRGPVDKVAETFAQVIAGLEEGDGGSFYFQQAQRNHLKHYIYLLKLHEPEQEVTFDMLLDMYNNSQLVRKMHVMLKGTFPQNIDSIENRDKRNYWKIVQGIDEWFDLNLVPMQVRQGQTMQYVRTEQNEIKYEDAKAEHVQGLRNILNDMGANPLIRRVLFGKSNFDFDVHLNAGGILLVNTAKGELVKLAQVLGKIVLMNLQNSTFRREPIVSPFHHILIDEAPDYLYNAFSEFPAQSRKYKVIITTLKQTIAQLAAAFGEHYMTTLIGTMRNRMVYGDVPSYDAKYFSEMFGEKYFYEEGQSEMGVSPLQEDPVTRSGSSYSLKKDVAMTSGEIMFQDAFQCAVKIVNNNKPIPVQQINANFVPSEEFLEAKIIVKDKAAQTWLEHRNNYMTKKIDMTELPNEIQSIEVTEEINAENYEAERRKALLDEASIERAIAVEVDKNPRNPVSYNDGIIPQATQFNRPSVKQAINIVESVQADDVIDIGQSVKVIIEQPKEEDKPLIPSKTLQDVGSDDWLSNMKTKYVKPVDEVEVVQSEKHEDRNPEKREVEISPTKDKKSISSLYEEVVESESDEYKKSVLSAETIKFAQSLEMEIEQAKES